MKKILLAMSLLVLIGCLYNFTAFSEDAAPLPSPVPTCAPKDVEPLNPDDYEPLSVGSKGQNVLDARMKLYELGYFNSKPNQTEYTSGMAERVKNFERDYGLTVDGNLSSQDLAVLFAAKKLSPIGKTVVTLTSSGSFYSSDDSLKWSVELNWTAVDQATGYNVYRSTKSDGEYEYIGCTAGLSFVDTEAPSGKVFYQVESVSSDVELQPSFSKAVSITNKYTAITKVAISEKKITLNVGQSKTIQTKITPEKATYQKLSWTSSNTDIVTVDENGKIKAVYCGTATITASAKDGSGKQASVTVFVPSMSCNTTDVYLTKGVISIIEVKLYTKDTSAIKLSDGHASNNNYHYEFVGNTLRINIRPFYSGNATLTITDANSPDSTLKIGIHTSNYDGFNWADTYIMTASEYSSYLRSNRSTCVVAHGYVQQVEYNDDGSFWMFISTKGKYDNWAYVKVDWDSRWSSDPRDYDRVLKGDEISVLGWTKGPYTYQTVRGSSNTVLEIEPLLYSDWDSGWNFKVNYDYWYSESYSISK